MTRQPLVAVLLVALAVGLSVGPAAALPVQDSGATEGTSGTVTDLQTAGNTTITFENQTSEGRNVTIGSVNLSEGGFISIHTTELLNGSVLGSLVGTSEYLEPGQHENVTVTLNESLAEEQTLIAIAYQDTNGNEEFDFVDSRGQDDGAYVIENEVVVDDAVVTPGPAVEPTEVPVTTVAETTEVGTTSGETTEAATSVGATETTEVAVDTTKVAGTTEIGTEAPPATMEPTSMAPTETEVGAMTTEATTELVETTAAGTTEVGTTAAVEPTTAAETTEIGTTEAGLTETTEQPLPEETTDGIGGALSPGQPGFGIIAALAGLAGGLYLFRRENDDR